MTFAKNPIDRKRTYFEEDGELDDMHDNAKRAASEISKTTFLSIPGETHLSAAHEVDMVFPHVLDLLTDMR
ncbi:MAG: hypothetical protein ACFFDD_14125 [Promethearchaeota archaeon]